MDIERILAEEREAQAYVRETHIYIRELQRRPTPEAVDALVKDAIKFTLHAEAIKYGYPYQGERMLAEDAEYTFKNWKEHNADIKDQDR